MAKSDLVDIACEIRSNDPNKKAFAITDGTMEEVRDKIGIRVQREKWFWIPRSIGQINDDGTVTVPDWFAIKEGLV